MPLLPYGTKANRTKALPHWFTQTSLIPSQYREQSCDRKCDREKPIDEILSIPRREGMVWFGISLQSACNRCIFTNFVDSRKIGIHEISCDWSVECEDDEDTLT